MIELHVKCIVFKLGDALVLWQKDYQYCVEIGKIVLILLDDQEKNIEFIAETLLTTFNPCIRFYEIMTVANKKYECININNLNYEPLNIYTLNIITGVKLKHALVN